MTRCPLLVSRHVPIAMWKGGHLRITYSTCAISIGMGCQVIVVPNAVSNGFRLRSRSAAIPVITDVTPNPTCW